MEEINIKLPTPYKYEERIITKMEGLQKNGDKIINAFIGFREVTAIFYLYLFKKYKTSCFLYNDNNELLAVAKLSRPLTKDFTKEALIRIKLDY